MAKISTYPDGGELQAGDQLVIARAGNNKSILGGKVGVNRTSFTPAVAGTTIAGAGTYTTQSGYYTRIGNLVFFHLALIWTAHTGTGNMSITGLPFAAVNDGLHTPVTIFWSSITLSAVGNKIMGLIFFSASTISLFEVADGAAANLPIDTAGTLRISGVYPIA